MKKITLEEATSVGNKVNDIIQSSYLNDTTFELQDVVNAGLTVDQAKRVLTTLVRSRMLYAKDGKYMAHPKTLEKVKNEGS